MELNQKSINRLSSFVVPLAATLAAALIFNRYIAIATLAYSLLVVGLIYRKNREFHVRMMSSGIGLDISLVLFLEVTRNAIKTATGFSLGPFQYVHIVSSTLAVLFYMPIIFSGVKMYRGQYAPWRRGTHIRIGIVAFVFRTVGFLTMFSMFKR